MFCQHDKKQKFDALKICTTSIANLLWECVLYLIIIIKLEVWIINHCFGLGHETNGMRCMFYYVLIAVQYNIIMANASWYVVLGLLMLYSRGHSTSTVQGAIWPSLSPCTVINPILLTYLHLQCAHNFTHRGRDKMAAISQTTFSKAFSIMKMYKFRLRFHWSLLPMVHLTIFQHWFR